MRALSLAVSGLIGIANAACPYMTGELNARDTSSPNDAAASTEEFLSQFYLNDNNTYMTTDVGGPIEDQNSLSVGERGPTLLEDFIFRQKIQRFDHERVCGPHLPLELSDLTKHIRSPNVPSMRAVLALTVSSPRMATSPTSLPPRSCPQRANRPPCSPGSRPSPEVGVVRTWLEMSTALRLVSIPMKATLVC